MTPPEIKAALERAQLSQVDIARVCNVTPTHVNRVIEGHSTSHPVQSVIAAAIDLPVELVFPARYAPKDNTGKIARLVQVNKAVRAAG